MHFLFTFGFVIFYAAVVVESQQNFPPLPDPDMDHTPSQDGGSLWNLPIPADIQMPSPRDDRLNRVHGHFRDSTYPNEPSVERRPAIDYTEDWNFIINTNEANGHKQCNSDQECRTLNMGQTCIVCFKDSFKMIGVGTSYQVCTDNTNADFNYCAKYSNMCIC